MIKDTQIRFLIAGLINTMFGISLGFVFIKYLPLHYSLSLFLATLLGVIFNYLNSSIFVFKVKKSFKSLLFFCINYVFIYLLNIFLISVFVSLYAMEEQYAFLLTAPVGVVITYFVQKNFIFKIPNDSNY